MINKAMQRSQNAALTQVGYPECTELKIRRRLKIAERKEDI
jgi:hypothetical protein